MQRLIFLVEGDPDRLKDFSGIPHFLTRALFESTSALGIELEIIKTDYLFNVEELMQCIDQLKQGSDLSALLPDEDSETRWRKLRFPLNEQLLCELQPYDDETIVSALARYYMRVAVHTTQRIRETLRHGDVLLSQNHFYPYTGSELAIYYFLDTGLVDFYFDGKFGSVSDKAQKQSIAALYRQLESSALKGARGIFCFSEAAKNGLRESYCIPEERFTIAGAGINMESFPGPILREAGPTFHLLFVGLDFERKGGKVLLEAMEFLRGEPVKLTVVTRAEVAGAATVPENVLMYPRCNKEGLSALYRAADAFIFPTLFEPFGIVLCEAMSFSLPVISCHVAAVPWILGLAESVLLVQPGDARGLVNAVRYLMEHEGLRAAIGKHNYLRAERVFQWKHVTSRIISRCLSDSFSEKPVATS